jgi:Domain of unknown function (DUF4406)
MNNLNIKPGMVFISGPINGNLVVMEKLFAKTERILNELGHDVANQFVITNAKGLSMATLKYTVTHLINCNTIVTLENWEKCEFAKKQVEVARVLGIDVIDFAELAKHINKKTSSTK